MNANTLWKILLISSILVVIIGLYTFNNLDLSISGDGIPNSPQKVPSTDYPWRQVLSIIVVVGTAAVVAFYSFYKFISRPLRLIH
ncbi:MAG: hypothetical protein QG670_2574 [Thermoproteota archaeon]|nr:hypothetical protein [Thermoproteota archaeon]